MRKRKTCGRKQSAKFNCHHLLWQGRHWKQGYAKLLREHPYFKVNIPKDTLHREIHSKIHDIPTPNGAECRKAYELLLQDIASGKLDVAKDSISKRLDFLIEIWENSCPATVAMLRWQKDAIAKFYFGERGKQRELCDCNSHI